MSEAGKCVIEQKVLHDVSVLLDEMRTNGSSAIFVSLKQPHPRWVKSRMVVKVSILVCDVITTYNIKQKHGL